MKKWTNLRDCWRKSILLHNDTKKSGSGKKPSKLYVYHEQLKFLKKNSDFSIAHESISTETNRENEQVINNEEQSCTEPVQENKDTENMVSTPISAVTNGKKRKITKMNEVDVKMIKFMDHQIKSIEQSKKEDDNRHLFFFKGLLPSLESLNDDQTLAFQRSVITALEDIKKKSNANNVVSQYNYTPNSNFSNNCQTSTYFTSPQQISGNYQDPYSPSAQGSSTEDSFPDFENL